MPPLSDSSAGSTTAMLHKIFIERMSAKFDESFATLKQDKAMAAVYKAI